MLTHLILYVEDQDRSTSFYSNVLAQTPVLNVPGMTEFALGENCVLGLMPESGIKKLLGSKLPDPASARGIPRAEIYMVLYDAECYYERALQSGGIALSEMQPRDWGQVVAYCLDPDAHVIAFAKAER